MSNWPRLLGFSAVVFAGWVFVDSLFELLYSALFVYDEGFSYFIAGYFTAKLVMLGLSFAVLKYFYGVEQDE